MAVEFKVCALFLETFGKHPEVLSKLDEFRKQKSRDPLMAFGSSDKSFTRGTPIAEQLPKLRKAHLTHDISVLYDISGRNPTIIKLYAVLSHDESGTGQPVNIRLQKGIARQLANQQFDS
jgi:hypothetical protein